MATRRALVLVLASVFASMGAASRTPNFAVEAPTPEIARQVGQYAEHYRKEKAVQWLGQEMPQWPEPCPLRVTVTMNGSSGATTFAFHQGQIVSQRMHIEGTLDRLLASVLPHEITHTVFAHRFRCPVPRWADEGGSVLSEDDAERARHDQLVRQILNTSGRAIPLRRLFALREYPGDVMALYAEGYSVANFLVAQSNRATFLNFVAHGMSAEGWDRATQTHYRYRNIEELEQAWLAHLRSTKKQPNPQGQLLAQNAAAVDTPADRRILVRLTVPPAQPLEEQPRAIYRGQAPDPDEDRAPAPAPANPPTRMVTPTTVSAGRDGWQPTPPVVRILPPQFDAPPSSPPPYPR